MCLPWFSFYGLAGDSMHNMNLSLILIPASGPIVSFKFSLLCITNQSKTLLRPISPTTARKPQANASPTKSIPTNPSSPPSKPPATPAPAKSSPQNKSKSSSPSSANPESPPPKSPKSTTLNTTKGETSGLALKHVKANMVAKKIPFFN